MMISYNPLWKTLKDKNLDKWAICKDVTLSKNTMWRLKRGEYVTIRVIEKICLTLNCPIESVVEVYKMTD